MDKLDSVTEQQNALQAKKTLQKLDGEAYVSNTVSIGTFSFNEIYLGNTGFILQMGQSPHYPASFHFVPEKSTEFSPGEAARYASMLAFSLNSLYNLLKDNAKMQKLDLNPYDLPWIYANTNQHLIRSLKNLFSNHESGELVDTRRSNQVGINLTGFRNLNPDSPLISYLERVSLRASSIKVLTKRS